MEGTSQKPHRASDVAGATRRERQGVNNTEGDMQEATCTEPQEGNDREGSKREGSVTKGTSEREHHIGSHTEGV